MDTDVEIAAHAVCVRTAMLSLYPEKFLRFQLQESIPLLISKCRGQPEDYPMTKLAKISEMGSLHRGFLVTLH